MSAAAIPPPAPSKAYVRAHCPAPGAAPTPADWLKLMHEREQCLQKAMNAALDRILLPLEKRDPDRFHHWMQLQAKFNEWVNAVCDAQESLRWIDVPKGRVGSGTGDGETRSYCRQRMFATRGWFATELADGHLTKLRKTWLSQQREGKLRWDALESTIADVKQARARAPSEGKGSPVGAEKWEQLQQQLSAAMDLGNQLGREQCSVLSPAPKDCSSFFPNALFTDVHLDDRQPELD